MQTYKLKTNTLTNQTFKLNFLTYGKFLSKHFCLKPTYLLLFENLFGYNRYRFKHQSLNFNYFCSFFFESTFKNHKIKKEGLNEFFIKNINLQLKKNTYRGYRHYLCFPVNGQSKRTNGNTQKSLGNVRKFFFEQYYTPKH